ncbi:MAG: hypothetical protein ABIE84_05525 [bacterium]
MKRVISLLIVSAFCLSSLALAQENPREESWGLEFDLGMSSYTKNFIPNYAGLSLGLGLAYKSPFIREGLSGRVAYIHNLVPAGYPWSVRNNTIKTNLIEAGVEYEKNRMIVGGGTSMSFGMEDSALSSGTYITGLVGIHAYLLIRDLILDRTVGGKLTILPANLSVGATIQSASLITLNLVIR